MTFLDMKSVLAGSVLSSALCALVMASLWFQSRKRSPETALWLVDYVMQFTAVLLLALRGVVPDVLSFVASNVLVVAGTVILYRGLGRFVGKPTALPHNYVMLVVLAVIHWYFTFVQPILALRTLNVSVGLALICVQCAWLMLRRVEPDLRSAARPVGLVFLAFSATAGAHAVVALEDFGATDFFRSGSTDTVFILAFQWLFVALTFALLLLVSRRLQQELGRDILDREEAEQASRKSEAKFAAAFQSVPDAVLITTPSDGRIIEANENCFRTTGFTKEEMIGKTTIGLGLWVDVSDRERFLDELERDDRVSGFECEFRRKSGEHFPGVVSGEAIEVDGELSLLIVLHDATEHKLAEQRLTELSNRDPLTGLLNYRAFYAAASERLASAGESRIALIFMDVDRLKFINDEYGHLAGDEALITFASALREAFRESDLIGRLGGDEFTVLATSRENVADETLVSRLATVLGEKNLASELPFEISVSIGFAWWDPAGGVDSLPELVRRADARMYEAKRSGY